MWLSMIALTEQLRHVRARTEARNECARAARSLATRSGLSSHAERQEVVVLLARRQPPRRRGVRCRPLRPSREVIEIGARVLWMQFGVGNDEAPHSVGDAGRGVIMDRCCKIEHASFLGGQRTMGLNTGGDDQSAGHVEAARWWRYPLPPAARRPPVPGSLNRLGVVCWCAAMVCIGHNAWRYG